MLEGRLDPAQGPASIVPPNGQAHVSIPHMLFNHFFEYLRRWWQMLWLLSENPCDLTDPVLNSLNSHFLPYPKGEWFYYAQNTVNTLQNTVKFWAKLPSIWVAEGALFPISPFFARVYIFFYPCLQFHHSHLHCLPIHKPSRIFKYRISFHFIHIQNFWVLWGTSQSSVQLCIVQ